MFSVVNTGKFRVMSATTVEAFTTTMNPDGGATIKIDKEDKSVFPDNGPAFDTEEQARAVAAERTRMERRAGNMNIDWYPIPESYIAGPDGKPIS